MNTIKLFDGTTLPTTPETFHKDACASLSPWMEKGDKIARYTHGAGFIYYVSTYGELTDACAVVSQVEDDTRDVPNPDDTYRAPFAR